jgi:DNA-binding response OmpR family regulator
MPEPLSALLGAPGAAAPAPPTVLVVDDSDTIRKFVTFALRARGLRVVTARDGLEALEKLAAEPADLVITDLNMPGLDGYGLVRALREDDPELPIIVLSSLSSEEDVQRGLDLGANAYLVKPFDPKRIQYEVAKYLQ